MRSFRRTLQFLAPYRGMLILAVILTLFVTVLQILPPRLFQFAIDQGITPALKALSKGANQATRDHWLEVGGKQLGILAGLLISIISLRAFLNYWLAVLVSTIGHRFCFDLRFATWRHLQRLSLAFHKQTQTGKIMARATADVELIQNLVSGQLVAFLSDLITLVAVLGILFSIEWRIASIILCLIPLYVASYVLFLKHIRVVRDEQRRLYDVQVGQLTEKIQNIQVVKAFVREDDETQAFLDTAKLRFACDSRQTHLNRRLTLVSGLISAVGTGVVYAFGGKLVQQNVLSVGQIVALTFYIRYVFDPAVRVVDFNTSLQWAIAAMDRVFETLDTRPDIEDRSNAVVLGQLNLGVAFHHAKFKYAQGDEILAGIDLVVEKGQVIGIVGASGSGKTTLMNLLMRFYDPTEGSVKIDGHDLRDVRLESLRTQIGMVAQENIMFSVSLRENVKYGLRNATDDQVIKACKAADLHDFIAGLDDGYDTMVGEYGIKLSGGQKQRLALARALVTDPSILILDDVTSALDGETEAKVQEALRRVMKGRTTFIIAHRLTSVVDSDRIIVIDGGKIVEQGPHDELVTFGGLYQAMFEEQFRGALERHA